MRCFTLFFLFFPVFSRVFDFLSCVFTCVWYQHVSIQNASENARKTYEKNVRKLNLFPLLHYALGKNANCLPFFSRFGTFEVTKMQTQYIV